jgi:fatty aldehyde decarbonylase
MQRSHAIKVSDFTSDAYRDAYSRINGLVVVGEGLADRHFRLLARSIPEDRDELERLAAMEGRHATDFVGCGRHLGIKPDVALARRLFAPLHQLFLDCDRAGDLTGCLVIQGLIVECFAVAAYRCYLPVADSYARPITAAVIDDEAEHLNYAERWLGQRLVGVAEGVLRISTKALPITLGILQALSDDLQTVGIDPVELLGCFTLLFQQALEAIGLVAAVARRILIRAAAASVAPA